MMQFFINYPEAHPNIGIIPFLHENNLKLSYMYTDIFSLLDLDSEKIKNEFLSRNLNISTNHSYLKLIELLGREKIRTVFCLKEDNGKLRISKGSKKLVAMAVNDLSLAHCLIVSKNIYSQELTLDQEIFDLLYQLDPTLETVRCDFIEPSNPSIHILENIEHVKNWRFL